MNNIYTRTIEIFHVQLIIDGQKHHERRNSLNSSSLNELCSDLSPLRMRVASY